MTGPMTWADATPQRVSARMTAGRILRAELTKLTTMRSNWIAGLFAIVASGGVAALNTAGDASNWHSVTAAERVGFDPIQSALFSVIVGALTFGSLGARSISAEYSTGMIRVSLAAMHHRSQVVLSKAALIAAYGFAIGIASNIAALAVGSAMFDAKGLDLPLDNWENVVAVVLGALAVSALGVVGVSLGTLLRRPNAADLSFALFLFGGQMFAPVLPDTLDKFVPMNALLATVSAERTHEALNPVLGLAVITTYAIVLLAAATQSIVRRDA